MRSILYTAPGIGNWTDVPDGCICEQDGFCPKFGREMHGRMRQICRGIDVDIGTAANFRAEWCRHLGPAILGKKEICAPCNGKERQVFECYNPALSPHETTVTSCQSCEYQPKTGRKLLLRCNLSPGDALVMSAAIYSLHRTHPGKFQTAIQTHADELFQYNPDISECDGELVEMHYPEIHRSDERGIHFMQAYCEFLESVLGVRVPLLTNRPRVYLSKSEMLGTAAPYWVVCAGGKTDFTCKQWPHYQEVVDKSKVSWVQVGAAEHDHPPLRGVDNMVGKTSLRELVRLVYHSKGVLCSTTLLMHLAAALERPAIIIMGGREPVQWNSYPKQHLLHSIGQLPCCEKKACWKSRVTKLNDGSAHDELLCERPLGRVAECMNMITAAEILSIISRYK